MAITKPPGLLTYEAYLAEREVNRRYHIIDGVRIFMAAPTWRHQRIQFNINQSLHRFEEDGGIGLALGAPLDILIRRDSLRTRQPDVFYISNERLAIAGGVPEKGVLEIAPELAVEIISDTERRRDIDEKIADYIAIGVKECWLVWPETQTVEVLLLTPEGAERVATYDDTQTLQSMTFRHLTVAVAEFFKP